MDISNTGIRNTGISISDINNTYIHVIEIYARGYERASF